MSQDPVGIKSGPNFYRAFLNKPLIFSDPSGLYNATTGGQPGAVYSTPDEAAQSAYQDVWGYSMSNDVEVGGYIYRDPNTGYYGYSPAAQGNDSSVGISIPSNSNQAGTYHTHPGDSSNPYNSYYSPADTNMGRTTRSPVYLMDPNGNMTTYNPNGSIGAGGTCPQY